MEYPTTFHNSKHNKLIGILSTPTEDLTKPIIIFVHGHSSDKNTKNFVRLTEIFNANHIPSLRFDISGHGESEGVFEEITVSQAVDDILSAIKFIKEKGYKKIGIIGSSFGGLASIIAASKTPELFCLVLKSPVSNYEEKYKLEGKHFLEDWEKKGVRSYQSGRKGKLKLNYSFYEDAVGNDGYKVSPHIKSPTLIVHGDQDTVVPVEQSINLARLIPGSRLEIIHDADHTYSFPRHADEMIAAISEFVIQKSIE